MAPKGVRGAKDAKVDVIGEGRGDDISADAAKAREAEGRTGNESLDVGGGETGGGDAFRQATTGGIIGVGRGGILQGSGVHGKSPAGGWNFKSSLPLLVESAVRADPNDQGAWLVYADELQERGDPRGELIVLDYELRAMEGDRIAQQALAVRGREVRDSLFGMDIPVAKGEMPAERISRVSEYHTFCRMMDYFPELIPARTISVQSVSNAGIPRYYDRLGSRWQLPVTTTAVRDPSRTTEPRDNHPRSVQEVGGYFLFAGIGMKEVGGFFVFAETGLEEAGIVIRTNDRETVEQIHDDFVRQYALRKRITKAADWLLQESPWTHLVDWLVL